jgi:L-seryl-tRNA(Ser) seleniumtransferase
MCQALPAGEAKMSRRQTTSGKQPDAGALRALPAVDVLARALRAHVAPSGTSRYSEAQIRQAARTVLQQARDTLMGGESIDSRLETLVARSAKSLGESTQPAPRPVVNATGVIINTNLGRAPLSSAALAAMAAVAGGYSALEYDLAEGERGSRQAPVRELLRELLGAEDAIVVNNNASAILVVLSALACAREVVISRGELVEIGGGFRIPDVMRQSGASLVEVGTTNRTRVNDYGAAITDRTAILLSVHPSNFRVIGFTATPALAELAQLAHRHHVPLVHDVGSGSLLHTEHWQLAHEPMPQESLIAGADLVCFSGDKMLGGPQAGIVAGKAELVARIERHPLMRAIRIDKSTLAALVSTLRAYRDGVAEREIPIWRMITMPLRDVKARAEVLIDALHRAGISAHLQQGLSTIGGGSLPGETLPTWLCAIEPKALDAAPIALAESTAGDAASALATGLRRGAIPVVARVSRDRVLLDPRTVLPEQDALLLQALHEAFIPD